MRPEQGVPPDPVLHSAREIEQNRSLRSQYRNVTRISVWDQDRFLGQHESAGGWTQRRDPLLHRFRQLRLSPGRWRRLGASAVDGAEPLLDEWLLPWPSAPLYRFIQAPDYELTLRGENYHYIRVLRRTDQANGPADHTFICFNGLNEDRELRFYYEMAVSLLCAAAPYNNAVVIYPTPGHLSRYPVPGPFSESALHRYLKTPADLFRQFLRLMVETEWLLAALVPGAGQSRLFGLPVGDLTDDLRNEAGKPLSDAVDGSSDAGAKIALAFETIRQCNIADGEGREGKESGVADAGGPALGPQLVRDAVGLVRSAVWGSAASPVRPPSVNLVGYSLGGFYARSAFFSWPGIVSSCSNICSGGPLRDIILSEFAEPEEWQSVIHGIRYELTQGFLGQTLGQRLVSLPALPELEPVRSAGARTVATVAGIPQSRFSFLLPIFEDVFVQDSRNQYANRAGEYKDRMLFVVGGDDPIIRSSSVLESGPSGGNNVIQIANLGHFVHSEPAEFYEEVVPRISLGVVASAQAGVKALAAPAAPTRTYGTGRRARNIPLSSDELQGLLRDICTELGEGESFLLVSRSRPVTVLLDEEGIRAEATRLHFGDGAAESYCRNLLKQQEILLRCHERVTLLQSEKGVRQAAVALPVAAPYHTLADGRTPTAAERHSRAEEFHTRLVEMEGGARYVSFERQVDRRELDEAATALIAAVRGDLYPGLAREHAGDSGPGGAQAYPVLNSVANCWIFLNGSALNDARSFEYDGAKSRSGLSPLPAEGDTRSNRERWFLNWAVDLFTSGDDGPALEHMKKWVERRQLRVFRFSEARHDQSFRGHLVEVPRLLQRVWVHAALTMAYSERVTAETPPPV